MKYVLKPGLQLMCLIYVMVLVVIVAFGIQMAITQIKEKNDERKEVIN